MKKYAVLFGLALMSPLNARMFMNLETIPKNGHSLMSRSGLPGTCIMSELTILLRILS